MSAYVPARTVTDEAVTLTAEKSSVERSGAVMRDRLILTLLRIPPQSPAVTAPPFTKGEAKSKVIILN